MSETLFLLADRPITAGEITLALLALGVVLLLALLFVLPAQARARRLDAERAAMQASELEERMGELNRIHAEMTGRVQAMAEVFGARQSDLANALSERLDGMSQRLGQSLDGQTRSTMENLGKLNERLAVIDSAQKNLSDLAGQVVTLKDVFANKQARGAFGQARMEAILTDGLPSSAFTLQATLSNNKRPDALIHLPGDPRGLAIDAKFPLESVTLWREAKDPQARILSGQKLRVDLATHVKDVAEKYLIAGETQDLALLFIPSEGIYADIHEHFDDIMQKAFRARVVIVSPTLLMLAIQVTQSLLKDERMREEARVIQSEVSLLLEDVRRLVERVGNLQRHFGQASDDLTQIQVSADKIQRRAARVESLEFDEPRQPAQSVVKLPLKGAG